MKLTSIWILLAVAVMAIFFVQCRKDNFITDPSAKLEFSTDTVLFDTVFTSVGSTTKILKVYNRNDQRIKISSIQLGEGSDSNYRINVDGISADFHEDVEIAANDSMFVFVEVTVDPNDLNTPFVVEDDLLFYVNSNEQNVKLAAWGQNAYFHGSSGALTVLPENDQWFADKPHVIYGIVAVDSANTLTIGAGTQVHVHANSGLYIYKGQLHVEGELGNEVVFQGDRLEPLYDDEPGQWGIVLGGQSIGGIYLFQSEGSTINYSIIKNGIVGLQVDTLNNPSADALTLTNTKIDNMSAVGLLARGSKISGNNNLISNCGQTCAAFTLGGEYQFDFCTFANYWQFENRQDPTFVLSNFYTDIFNNLQVRPLTNTYFRNCIMYGNNASVNDFNEFAVFIEEPEFQEYDFEYCLVDTDINVNDSEDHYTGMVNGIAPSFVGATNNDFHPSAAPSAMTTPFFPGPSLDLDGVSRPGSNGTFEKGCYEYNP